MITLHKKKDRIHCLPEEQWNMQLFARNETSLEHFKAILHVNSKIEKISTKIVDAAEDNDKKISNLTHEHNNQKCE